MNKLVKFLNVKFSLLLISALVLIIFLLTQSINLMPFYITFKLAFLTTLILLIIGIPLAYFIAYSKWKAKIILESLLSLPVILPPTVLGYYFIVVLGPNSTVGRFFSETLGVPLIFSFEGILLGSIIYCTPFMIYPIVNGFRSLPASLFESAILLGKSKRNILWYVLLPNIKGAVTGAILLSFAHTIGEFGVVLMIGGNLPETRVASIAIYDQMNQMNYGEADAFALVLLAFSFLLIVGIQLIRKSNKPYFA